MHGGWLGGLWVLGAGMVASASPGEAELGQPPMFGRATSDGITWTVHAADRPVRLRASLRREEAVEGERDPWRSLAFDEPVPRGDLGGRIVKASPGVASSDILLEPNEYFECQVSGLEEGVAYRWRISVEAPDANQREGAALPRRTWRGRFVTVRPAGEPFTFAVMADMHCFIPGLEPRLPDEGELSAGHLDYALRSLEYHRKTQRIIEAEYRDVAARLSADRPDFVVGLGDHFDLHSLDFNGAFVTRGQAELAHGTMRTLFSETLARCGAYYQLIGNWEGESGDHAPGERALAISARRRHQVNPRNETPGARAGDDEDYYAWTWGDVFLIALNVRGYTPLAHNLGHEADEGGADDFTLGVRQKAFTERELRAATQPYKIVLIHHALGGNAGDAENSAYGRGGGRAAHVGEQAWLHQLMRETGVQVMFYGHDHVFKDMIVDGIHYSLPGTTSAPWRFESEVTGYDMPYWTESGFGRVRVEADAMTVEFVERSGTVLLEYSVAPFKGE